MLDDIVRADDPGALLCPADFNDLLRHAADMEASGTSACGLTEVAAGMYRAAFMAPRRTCHCRRCRRSASIGAAMVRRNTVIEAAQNAWEINVRIDRTKKHDGHKE